MATIYRFIVENRARGGTGEGRNPSGATSKKGAGKKGTNSFSLLSSDRGGVEHNRRMRAINPLLNKATGGYWEKGMRVSRAGIGMANNIEKYGAKGIFAGPSLAIIIALVIQAIIKWQNKEREKAQQRNAQNYKSLENGFGTINSAFTTEVDFWTGRQTYNQNK